MVKLITDIYCPTFITEPHTGRRGFLIYRLRLPKKWFKPEKQERVSYRMPDGTWIVSPENYEYYSKAFDAYALDIKPTIKPWR